MTLVAPAPYDRARRGAVLDLLERVWGERPDEAEFAWWLEQAPAGEALLSLAEDGGQVVGVAAMSLLRCRVGGSEELVPMPLQVATDPGYRGRGIFTALERANEDAAAARGCRAGVTFPNAASRPIFLERLGWAELWRGRLWARPPVPALPVGRLRLERLDRIPPEAGELDADGNVNGQILDAELLTWRYLRSPRAYRVTGAFEGDRLCGLLAVRPRRGRAAVVGHALGEVGQLLRATASARPAIALVPRAQRRAFTGAGFVPTPKTVSVLGKRLRADGALAGAWRFQLGDFDVF